MKTDAITGIQTDRSFLTVAFLVFIMSPLGSLPLVFYGIYHRKYGSFFLLSLFFGILAWLTTPQQDMYRHMQTYYFWQNRPFSHIGVLDVALSGTMVYIHWAMSHLRLPFEILRMFELVTGFYMLCIVFNYTIDASSRVYTKRETFFRFLIFLFFFDLLYTIEGVRYGYAICLYIFSLHQMLNRQRMVFGIAMFLLAAFWHMAFLYFGLTTFVLYYMKLKKRTMLLMTAVVYGAILLFITQLGFLLGRRLQFYFSGKGDKLADYSNLTAIGLTVYMTLKAAALPFVYLLLKYYQTHYKWCRLAMAWIILSVAFSFNAITFLRCWWVFTALGVFTLLEIEEEHHLTRRFLYITLFAGLVFTGTDILKYHNLVIRSHFYRAATPVPYILTQTYDKQWIFQNIKTDGTFK